MTFQASFFLPEMVGNRNIAAEQGENEKSVVQYNRIDAERFILPPHHRAVESSRMVADVSSVPDRCRDGRHGRTDQPGYGDQDEHPGSVRLKIAGQDEDEHTI